MQHTKGLAGPILLHLTRKVQTLFQRKEPVAMEVREALQACQNMQELLDFLFSTDFYRDEAFQALFQQRIQELDAAYSNQSYFTL